MPILKLDEEALRKIALPVVTVPGINTEKRLSLESGEGWLLFEDYESEKICSFELWKTDETQREEKL